ncbi:hypothetical protein O0I10_011960 [Lichtheimia ornata]|uniref:Integrase catalytic domain-containing protein n=1 Tax=Lichtheimia ornata TaxID=688661 RepID=A0AAD7URV9_9FUNG|nr:uncharacterized protein O0I10_011960 [Lichtheimia ornata]KAJ8652428.1 hypothetical protein O0I10_011960 [Lichtheimia ornata]
MVDVCTRFCVLHALTDKTSDTVVKAVIDTFCDYGFPRYLQSDNGTEFVNTLMQKLRDTAGFDHRLTTPYHPRANGLAECFIQTSINTIRKSINGATRDWDLYVKPTQLALNNKVASIHGSSPFALMFNRAMNGFRNYNNDDIPQPLTEEELMDRIDHMSNTVFPAISERAQALQQLKKGPYTVVRETPGGSCVLRDEQGLLAARNFAPSQLKMVSQDELLDVNELYEHEGQYYTIQSIVDHKQLAPGNYMYRVRWEGYSANDTWEPPESFNSTQPIAEYWNKLGRIPPHDSSIDGNITQHTDTEKHVRKRSLPNANTSTRKSKRLRS